MPPCCWQRGKRKLDFVAYVPVGQLCGKCLAIDDLELCVYIPRNRVIERDIICEPSFIVNSINGIGESIRARIPFYSKST